MFQLAAFTDEISHDLTYACNICRDFNVTGVELRGIWQTGIHQLSDAQVRDVRHIVQDHGLQVCSIGSPFFKCELDAPDEREAHLDILKRCGDIARALDCTLIRGFAFWGHDRSEKPWPQIFEAFAPVPTILADKGVVLGLENEAACYVGTASHLRFFLDTMSCTLIKGVWDPANHVQDPDGRGVPVVPDAYDLVKQDVVHVHVKDAHPLPDGTTPNVFLGQGICMWPEQFRALQADHYEGYVSLETHVDADAFPEEMRRRYGHYLEGDAQTAASKVSLAWLQDALAALP